MRRILLLLPLLCCLLGGCANSLLYFPDRINYEPHFQVPVPHEDFAVSTEDGQLLFGWFLKAQGEPKGTVVFLHGNAQNLTAHAPYVGWLPAEGYNVVIADYRGFGLSSGTPSRQGLQKDARAMWAYACKRPDVDPERMILYGQSLGAVNALVLAGSERLPGLRGVVAEAPFSSYGRISREKMLQIPVLGLLLWPFSPLIVSPGLSPEPVVANIAPTPLLLIHGDRDDVVPISHSERLYRKAGSPKWLWRVPGAGHTEVFGRFRSSTAPRLLRFLDYALSGDAGKLAPDERAAAGLAGGDVL